jgi:hypothetical protein
LDTTSAGLPGGHAGVDRSRFPGRVRAGRIEARREPRFGIMIFPRRRLLAVAARGITT